MRNTPLISYSACKWEHNLDGSLSLAMVSRFIDTLDINEHYNVHLSAPYKSMECIENIIKKT